MQIGRIHERSGRSLHMLVGKSEKAVEVFDGVAIAVWTKVHHDQLMRPAL